MDRRVDENRLLSRNGVPPYTNSPYMALPNEPEAVTEAEQHRISVEGRTKFAELRQSEAARQHKDACIGRIRRIEAQARRAGVDPLPHLIALEQKVREIEDLLERAA